LKLSEFAKRKATIHTRDIRLATHPHKHSEIIVEGTLIDKSHRDTFDIIGKIRKPGIIHHIAVWLLIKGNPLKIAHAEAQMYRVPMDECKSTLVTTLEKIVGVEVKPGYSNTIRKTIGGKNGCTHLAHLITIMGQEIVHGWLIDKRRQKLPVPDSMENFTGNEYILNSCKMWSKGGPRWKILKKALQQKTNQA